VPQSVHSSSSSGSNGDIVVDDDSYRPVNNLACVCCVWPLPFFIQVIGLNFHCLRLNIFFIWMIAVGVTYIMCIVISSHTQHTPCDRFIVSQTINRSQVVCCMHAAVLYFQARVRCVLHVSFPSADYICSQNIWIQKYYLYYCIICFKDF
jgi:membrane protein insertase Oxa1/YidC/SpoIIIJ